MNSSLNEIIYIQYIYIHSISYEYAQCNAVQKHEVSLIAALFCTDKNCLYNVKCQ